MPFGINLMMAPQYCLGPVDWDRYMYRCILYDGAVVLSCVGGPVGGDRYMYTVYVPIEARYPIEARPPFREQKLHANVYICNKMESLSNQNDI